MRRRSDSSSSQDQTNGPQPLRFAQGTEAPVRRDRPLLLAARPRGGRRGEGVATSGVDPPRARVRPAQLRRQEGDRGARPRARPMGAHRLPRRRDPLRRRARRAAGLHRRAAARRPRRDAQRRPRAGQEPEGHRAARARRPRRRPLGDDRSLRDEGSAGPQHEARVPAQRGALRVHEVGDAGLRHVQGRAAGHRHRAPGEPRVPGARRALQERRVLPRHAGGHRQPHDDDQRHRRRRLGRGRHRGGSRDAGPAGLLPDARRRRRRADRPPAGRNDRHRPRADRHRDAAQGEGRRQVRRVLRRRRGDAGGDRPRDDREHGARVRRDDGLLPRRRRDGRLPALHRPHRRRDRGVRRLLQGAGPLRHAAQRRDRLHEGAEARPRVDQALGGGPEAPAGPDRARRAQVDVREPVQQARAPTTASRRPPPTCRSASRRPMASVSVTATC